MGFRALPDLEPVETSRQLRGDARAVDAIVLEDRGEVAVVAVEQLHQEVLDLDVVVGAAETQPRGGLDGAPWSRG